MDKLKQALQEDAAQINIEVSPELDARLQASIRNAGAVVPEAPAPRGNAWSFGWASALTGAAAAVLLLVVVNLDRPEPPASAVPPLDQLHVAVPSLNAETAVFTAPLKKELENLESDLRKAEQAVKREIGLGL
ncbi:MAG: hypothetical protein KJO82_12680 [Gammaproteobacteria bacterium]|nr:hypothetical protein [Gammaproteobacteria bacterium]